MSPLPAGPGVGRSGVRAPSRRVSVPGESPFRTWRKSPASRPWLDRPAQRVRRTVEVAGEISDRTYVTADGCPSPKRDNDAFAAKAAAQRPQFPLVAPCLGLWSERSSGWSSLCADKRPPCARQVALFEVRERQAQPAIGYAARRS